jgi:hypothetical protein
MPDKIEANEEQIAKVLEVIKRWPRGAMIEKIRAETDFSNDIIWSAIHALERDGIIVGRDPFGYDPVAAAEAELANPPKS